MLIDNVEIILKYYKNDVDLRSQFFNKISSEVFQLAYTILKNISQYNKSVRIALVFDSKTKHDMARVNIVCRNFQRTPK